MERISIIIPAYNAGRYIAKAIESALTQTYPDIEVIIVNDGSTDNTGNEILKSISGHDNCICIEQKNAGVYKARENALKAATGDYIIFLDGDDWLDSEFASRMLKKLKDDNLDICFSQYIRTTDSYMFKKKGTDFGILKGKDYMEYTATEKIPVYLCCKIYRKSLFTEIPPAEGLWFGEDKYLNLSLGLKEPVCGFLDYYGYYYYQHAGSAKRRRYTMDYIREYARQLNENVLYSLPEAEKENIIMKSVLVWYRTYIRRSGNLWQGNSDFSRKVRKRVLEHPEKYTGLLNREDLFNIRIYRYRILTPIIFLKATAERLGHSISMRISRQR